MWFLAFRILAKNRKHTLRNIQSLIIILTVLIALFSILDGITLSLSVIATKAENFYQSDSVVITSDLPTQAPVIPEGVVKKIAILPEVVQVVRLGLYHVFLTLPSSFFGVNQTNSSYVTLRVQFWVVNITEYIGYYSDTAVEPDNYKNVSQTILNTSTGYMPLVLGERLLEDVVVPFPFNVSFSRADSSVSGVFNYFPYRVNGSIVGRLQNSRLLSFGLVVDVSALNSYLGRSDVFAEYSIVLIRVKDQRSVGEVMATVQSYIEQEGIPASVSSVLQNRQLIASIFSVLLRRFVLFTYLIYFLTVIRVYYSLSWLILQHKRDFRLLRILSANIWQLGLIIVLFSLIPLNIAFMGAVLLGMVLPSFMGALLSGVFSFPYVSFGLTEAKVLELFVVVNLIGVVVPLYFIYRVWKEPLVEKYPQYMLKGQL